MSQDGFIVKFEFDMVHNVPGLSTLFTVACGTYWLFTREIGQTEPQLEPGRCAGLYVVLLHETGFFSRSDRDVAAPILLAHAVAPT